jgi:integrase
MGRKSTPIHLLTAERRGSQAVVRYRGKRIPLGPWNVQADCPSEQAERKLAALKATWRVNPRAGLAADDDILLLDLWLRWASSPQAPNDRSSEATWCRRLLFGTSAEPGPYLETRVSQFTAGELQAFQDHLCKLVNDRGDLRFSRWSVTRFVSLTRRCLEWGVVAGLVDESQAATLKLVQPPKRGAVKEAKRRGGVEWDRVRAVAESLTSEAGQLLLVLWWTGARPGELCGLRAGQIQRSGVITNSKHVAVDLEQFGVWSARLEEHKTSGHGLERVLFFGQHSQAILGPLIEGRSDDEPVFQTKSGLPYNYKQIQNYTRRACRAMGIEYFCPYQIDHAFLARVAAVFSSEIPGSGILAAKAARGHSMPGVTEVYTGSDIVTAARVAQRCG